jgi:hypothetical protein
MSRRNHHQHHLYITRIAFIYRLHGFFSYGDLHYHDHQKHEHEHHHFYSQQDYYGVTARHPNDDHRSFQHYPLHGALIMPWEHHGLACAVLVFPGRWIVFLT